MQISQNLKTTHYSAHSFTFTKFF